MSHLIDQILENTTKDYFSDTELHAWLLGSNDSRHGLVKRAIAHEDLIQIRKGLYALNKRYQRRGLNYYELAQHIYGPSYVSFESALSYHGLIPEAVYTMTSATYKRSCSFKTPLGLFTYTPIPKAIFLAAVQRIQVEREIFLMASPVKALADLIYEKRLDWRGLEPVIGSLRIDEADLEQFNKIEIFNLSTEYPSLRVRKFLIGLLKDLET
ncbi:MAG: hypothetical protein WCK42_03670 [Myxococcaceae bacterium]